MAGKRPFFVRDITRKKYQKKFRWDANSKGAQGKGKEGGAGPTVPSSGSSAAATDVGGMSSRVTEATRVKPRSLDS